MTNKPVIILLLLACGLLPAQNSTFSPYSRYGLGERSQSTFAHNLGMGGAFVAFKPDSSMPVFINAGTPAAYSLIRITSLEVGGRFKYSDFSSGTSAARKWTTNFTYAALGFPVGGNGGMCLGLMPYSTVGYNAVDQVSSPVGNVTQDFAGSGGLNKAFAGYGLMPFYHRVRRYRSKNFSLPDSLQTRSHSQLMRGYFFSKLLGDLSVGAQAQYIFGNVVHTARYIYPHSVLYNNTYTERSMSLGDFTGNFGFQTGFTIDSVRTNGKRRSMSEKTKVTFGFFMALGNRLRANSSSVAYNYIVSSTGQEIVRDTVAFFTERPGEVILPVEQGIGMSFKKGERWNIAGDIGVTHWRNFSSPHNAARLSNSYRASIGGNYVPEKYAAGRNAFWRRVHYRLGASYETAYIDLRGEHIDTFYGSAGIGIPVGIGRISSMINISVQAGRMGTTEAGLLRENFIRLHFGFTFCDRWFQKYRYD